MPKAYVVTDELIDHVLAFAADVEAQRTISARLENDNSAAESRYQAQAEERSASLRALEDRHGATARQLGALEDKIAKADARAVELDARFDKAAHDYARVVTRVIGGDAAQIAAFVLAGDWDGLAAYLEPLGADAASAGRP